MVSEPTPWRARVAVVPLLAMLAGACATKPPIPTEELSPRLEQSNRVLAPAGKGPYPVVLLLHTCFGNLGHVDQWARRLQSLGYVAVVVNSMQARGLAGHFDNLAVCTGRAMRAADRARDIAISLDELRRRPSADLTRVAIVGFSHGAWTALDYLGEPLAAGSGESVSARRPGLRSIVAVYPYCGGEVEQGLDKWPRDVPVLMLLAGSDGTVGTAGCESLVRAQTTQGYAVFLHVYPGAKHGYDIDPALLDGYDERYDAPAALDTRKRIIEFLAQTLRSGAPELPPAADSGDARRVAEQAVHVQNSHRRLR